MDDEKKTPNEEIKNEELTDEQANKAAGGNGFYLHYTCAGCRKDIVGFISFIGDKGYCEKCYNEKKCDDKLDQLMLNIPDLTI